MSGSLKRERSEYPKGLKAGDFIQTSCHFGDIFFEVVSCFETGDGYWHVTYVQYDKYGTKPRENWVNSASSIRRIIGAEMAVPCMVRAGLRFQSTKGQYDPFYGYAPVGKALRLRGAAMAA